MCSEWNVIGFHKSAPLLNVDRDDQKRPRGTALKKDLIKLEWTFGEA